MSEENVKESELERSKRLIKEDQELRSQAVANGLKELLEKYNCEIIVYGNFQGNMINTSVNIVCKG